MSGKATGHATLRCENPRNGEFIGSTATEQGGATIDFGALHTDDEANWVALIRRNAN